MKTSTTVLLVLGFIYAVGGVVQFDPDLAEALQKAMQNVKEVDGLNPTFTWSSLGNLYCYDDEGGDVKLEVQDGSSFIGLRPSANNDSFVSVRHKPLDYEVYSDDKSQLNELKVSIDCYSVQNRKNKDLFEAYLNIQDVNDNRPIFNRTRNETYNTAIDEALNSVPLLIYTSTSNNSIRVIDADGPDNNVVTAKCVTMRTEGSSANRSCDGYFRVEARSEESGKYYFNIFAMRNNYTGVVTFILEIQAINVPTSGDEPTLYSVTQNVNINIRDLQNLPPNIDQDSLNFRSSEDLKPGSVLAGYIYAFDQDTGDPHAIVFEIVRPDSTIESDWYAFDNDLFALGDVTMDPNRPNYYRVPIVVQNQVDREAIPDRTKNLYLGIKAIEIDPLNRPNREKGTAQETFTIKIADVNDITPTFSQAVYYINITELAGQDANPESFQQISNNVDIAVEDTDSSAYSQFRVSIVDDVDGNFELDRYSGNGLERFSLRAKRKILDHEVLPNSYSLELRAVDADPLFSQSSTARVEIYIIDANDHSPTFQNDTAVFNILETLAPGTTIGTVVATDRDSGDFGIITSYEIIGDESVEIFSINSDGTIRLEEAVDFETRDNYYFTVLAFDGGIGGNKREGSISVIVQLVNVADTGPVFVSTYSATLSEESRDLVPNIQVRAQSRDADSGPIEYFIESIKPSSVSPTAFSLDRSTGTLNVVEFIDFKDTSPERPGVVSLDISAWTGGLSAITVVTIVITDINNFDPRFIPIAPDNIYYAFITEYARAGDVVFDLDVEDDDGADTKNGQVRFEVQSGANEDFLITPDSGVILVSSSATIDVEINSQYTIVVVAKDKGNPPRSATATVIVDVEDANNKNPQFVIVLYRFQMNANDAIDKSIGTVSATDPDKDHILRYSIDTSSVTFERQSTDFTGNVIPIKIDPVSGVIKVAGEIRRQDYDRIKMNVIVEDVGVNATLYGVQTASASVVIFILAADDPSIFFTNDGWDRKDQTIRVTFTESRAKNFQIVTLRATDPEIPATIQNYKEVTNSDPGDYFQVNQAFVFVTKPLDYEALPASKEVSVVVEAISDDGRKTATATIIVTVQDLNDNAPVFEKAEYKFIVPEDKKPAYRVGSVKATDLDSSSYGQVNYALLSASEDFIISLKRSGNEYEAVIYVAENATLDYETKPIYNLVIQAFDNPGPGNTVKFVTNVDVEIRIDDRNDMSPAFKEPVYNISIVGTKEVGGDVFYIQANDGDAGVNGQVDYSIVESTNDGGSFFQIDTVDQASGIIGEVSQVGRFFVRSSLENLPDRAMFVLTVYARDRGNPPTLPGTCKVIITVSKGVQDLKPKWDEQIPARVQIPEEEPVNTFVARLIAYPADVTSGIIYSFVRAGDALRDYDSFTIDSDTGVITTKAVLDYEDQKIFSLLVLATDSLNDTLTNQFLLIVQVLDIDDNQPSFADCPGKVYSVPETARVDEELPPLEYVYRAEACDRDDSPFNKVKYSWFIDNDYCSAENLNVFTLNETTGVVLTKIPLDREDTAQYMLCIEASRPGVQNPERDLQSLSQTNKLLFVEVTVNDVNDLGPKFYEPAIKTVILQYPAADISVAEAYDDDLPPNDRIRYSIDNIDFTYRSKTQNAPTAFIINANDGTIVIGTNDYTDYVGGYFDITVRAEDYYGANVPYDNQLQRVYVTTRANRIRVIFDEPADAGVDQKAKDMIRELNDKYEDAGTYFEIETISYHVVSNNADPSFDRTDVCLVVVENDAVLSAVSASSRLTKSDGITDTLEKYGAVDPGTCDPAVSVYPVGWESYWWVLVAFAIFIFVCCVILIFIICVLFRQYRQYMDSRKTYLVPGN